MTLDPAHLHVERTQGFWIVREPMRVLFNFGASGTLKDAIAASERAEVFASANMEHPRALASAGKSGPAVLFARNQLCALVRPGLDVTPATLLERMLDPE